MEASRIITVHADVYTGSFVASDKYAATVRSINRTLTVAHALKWRAYVPLHMGTPHSKARCVVNTDTASLAIDPRPSSVFGCALRASAPRSRIVLASR